MPGGAARQRICFSAVNQRGAPDYDPGLQRHHLLPRELLSQRCFGRMFGAIGRDRIGFDDFRDNGLLLPACDEAALSFGLPLHRGPHHRYTRLVIAWVGRVEADWSASRLKAPDAALAEALMRLGLLQRALRRRLLDPQGRRFALNRNDPLGRTLDFSDLDAMADTLWGDCVQIEEPSLAARSSCAS